MVTQKEMAAAWAAKNRPVAEILIEKCPICGGPLELDYKNDMVECLRGDIKWIKDKRGKNKSVRSSHYKVTYKEFVRDFSIRNISTNKT